MFLTPSCWMKLYIVTATPVVVVSAPAVKVDKQLLVVICKQSYSVTVATGLGGSGYIYTFSPLLSMTVATQTK